MFNNIKDLLISMLVVFKHIFKEPVTLEYPEKKKNPGENFRGRPMVKGCIKCGTCLKVCPTGAISIKEDFFEIDLKKCIFCGNCSYYCPKNAIIMSSDYELATNDVKLLNLKYKFKDEEEQNERNE